MEPRPATPPPWLPATRPAVPPPAAYQPPPAAAPPPQSPPPPPPGPRFDWRRFTRSPRGAAGLAILAAALLLWPFSGLSWIPWLAGLGALIVLRLLRLDGLLRGWDLPLAGVVVVAGLMISTTPWAWALAASIGMLLAGLAQLPWWRLAAVGAVLCLISGVGFGISTYQDRIQRDEAYIRGGDPIRSQIAEFRDDVLPALNLAVDSAVPDPEPLCRLVSPEALTQLLRTVGGQRCTDVVTTMHNRLRAAPASARTSSPLPKPVAEAGQVRMVINACGTRWAEAAGSELGRIHIEQLSSTTQTYVVASFSAC